MELLLKGIVLDASVLILKKGVTNFRIAGTPANQYNING